MKRKIYSRPELFGLSPMLALLPDLGDAESLQKMYSTLFARQETVSAARKEASGNGADAQTKAYRVEEEMLQAVLEWLSGDDPDSDDSDWGVSE